MKFQIDADIAKAKTISTDFYTDPEVYEQSKEKIFAPSWQFIKSIDYIERKDEVYPFTMLENFLDEPLMLTHTKDDRIHCLSNACTHRGNIVVEEKCNVPHLRCRYHGRQFALDGKFISMPEFKEVKGFPSKDDDLKQVPHYRWSNWLFASLNPAVPAENVLAEMMNRVSWMPLNEFKFRPEMTNHYHLNAHWALYCENYLEGFHIPFVHEGLNTVIDYGSYSTELYRYSNLQLGAARQKREPVFDLPKNHQDYGKKVAAYYFFVFPNMMFNFYPWGLSVNHVQPMGVAKTMVTFYYYVWDESKMNKGAGADLEKVEFEDEAIVHSVQKGIQSRFYKHGRYSVTREQGTHHFHRMIAECFNA
jgi:choline monooxygenase